RHDDPREGRRRAGRPHDLSRRRPAHQRRDPAGAALVAGPSAVKVTPLRRHVAAVVTIALSCACVAVLLLAGNLVQAALRSEAAQTYDCADLESTQEIDDDAWASEEPLAAPQVEGTDAVWPLTCSYLELSSAHGSSFLSAAMQPPGGAPQLVDGAHAES